MGIFTSDIGTGNPVNQELQTTNCPQLLHIFQHSPGYGYLSLCSLWVGFQAFSMSWIHNKKCDEYSAQDSRGNLSRSYEVFFALSTASSFLIQCSGDPSYFGLPQTPHFIFLTQRGCCTLPGITLPALQPGNSKQWAGAIKGFASPFSLTTVLPYLIFNVWKTLSYILSRFLVVSGGSVNLIYFTLSWPEAKVPWKGIRLGEWQLCILDDSVVHALVRDKT